MADQRFFPRRGPFPLAYLADLAGAELKDKKYETQMIHDVAPLDQASAGMITFLDNRHYIPQLKTTKAEAIILAHDLADTAPEKAALLLTGNPYWGYGRIASAFYPPQEVVPGCHPQAIINPGAHIHESACIEAGVVIAEDVVIGPRSCIRANSTIERHVHVGADCMIGPNVSLQYCQIGDRVRIHSGASIGQRGFGFALSEKGEYIDIPQLGLVVIKEDCEIGANVTIDRGSGPDTIIGPGSRIDNLVQIAHNVTLGRACIVIAQAGIAGSARCGDYVAIAAQGGVIGHITIGDHARIGAQAGVMRDVPAGAKVVGSPAMPHKLHWRQVAWVKKAINMSRPRG